MLVFTKWVIYYIDIKIDLGCEISTTMNLGGDELPIYLDQKKM